MFLYLQFEIFRKQNTKELGEIRVVLDYLKGFFPFWEETSFCLWFSTFLSHSHIWVSLRAELRHNDQPNMHEEEDRVLRRALCDLCKCICSLSWKKLDNRCKSRHLLELEAAERFFGIAICGPFDFLVVIPKNKIARENRYIIDISMSLIGLLMIWWWFSLW